VVAPVTPAQFSLSGLKITLEEVQDLSENHPSVHIEPKIVLNNFDSRRALSNEVLRALLNNDIFKNILCHTAIRSCQDFPNSIYSNATVFNSLRSSQAKEDIDLLVREILDLDEKILHKTTVDEDNNG
jgi:chromosome partitioning protein